MKKRFAVLASGNGTNLQQLINATKDDSFPGEISVVLSNNKNSFAMERAFKSNIPAYYISDDCTKQEFESNLMHMIDRYSTEWVCLAGFMKILSSNFVKNYKNKIINIHPSLLPSFKGSRVHKYVINSGVKIAGATVHFVNDGKVDSGPIIMQKSCPVFFNDSVTALKNRILSIEHEILPKAMRLALEGRLEIIGRKVLIKE